MREPLQASSLSRNSADSSGVGEREEQTAEQRRDQRSAGQKNALAGHDGWVMEAVDDANCCRGKSGCRLVGEYTRRAQLESEMTSLRTENLAAQVDLACAEGELTIAELGFDMKELWATAPLTAIEAGPRST